VHEAAPDGSPADSAAADSGGQGAAAALGTVAGEGTPQEAEEDAEMAAYNDYLAQLAERDKATGR
jgi:hypothetical protein